MKARRARSRRDRPGQDDGAGAAMTAAVIDLDGVRILRALRERSRYRYVQPRVERAAAGGWIVASPNCSRNIDPAGGEVAIAWFEPDGAGRWRLHARDHAAGRWCLHAADLSLAQALAQVCADEHRRYWQ